MPPVKTHAHGCGSCISKKPASLCGHFVGPCGMVWCCIPQFVLHHFSEPKTARLTLMWLKFNRYQSLWNEQGVKDRFKTDPMRRSQHNNCRSRTLLPIHVRFLMVCGKQEYSMAKRRKRTIISENKHRPTKQASRLSWQRRLGLLLVWQLSRTRLLDWHKHRQTTKSCGKTHVRRSMSEKIWPWASTSKSQQANLGTHAPHH